MPLYKEPKASPDPTVPKASLPVAGGSQASVFLAPKDLIHKYFMEDGC